MPTGKLIKEVRLKKGLTQKQLSERCGIADSNIRKYENGHQTPKWETLKRIADALDIGIEELMDKTPPPQEWFDMALATMWQAERLTDAFDKLNDTGREEAIKRVEELTEIPRYTKPDES